MSVTVTSVRFDILGRRFEANGVDPELADWLAGHWHRPHHVAAPTSFFLEVLCTREPALPHGSQERLPVEPEAGAGTAVVRVETHEDEPSAVVLGTLRGGAFLEVRSSTAFVQAWGVVGPLAPGRWPLLLALHDAVRASGLLPLHCAAAVRPGESGATAFLGPSGVGKSTTLLRLARAGWEPVCEDLAWLDPVSLQLYAWDDGIRLRRDAWQADPSLGDPGHRDARRRDPSRCDPTRPDPSRRDPSHHDPAAATLPKWRLSYEEVAERYGVRHRASAPLRRLAWLVRGEGPARWSRLSRQEAVPPLWEAIGLPLTQPTRRAVAAQVAALTGAVPLCALRLGTPADALPTAAPPD